jgi:hypothetical protein
MSFIDAWQPKSRATVPRSIPKDLERVLDAARVSGNSITVTTGVFATPQEKRPSQSWRSARSIQEQFSFPTFSPSATPFELLAQVRKAALNEDVSVDAFVNSMGFRLVELVATTKNNGEVEI